VSISANNFLLEDIMFAESMLETSWGERSRRGWMTLTSFGLQVVVIGILISVPFLTTVAIPLARTVSTPITMRRNAGTVPTNHRRASSGVTVISPGARLMMPGRIPTTITPGDDRESQITTVGSGSIENVGVDFGAPTGIPLPITGTRPVMPIPAAPTVHPFRASTMLQGSLVQRVEPAYPPLARAARIQGPVILDAVISKAGSIEHLQIVSGHRMLVPAALEAVSQWRYRPYILNGEAIEVETRITVNFVLQGN
jgi:periplasmic protein TonB